MGNSLLDVATVGIHRRWPSRPARALWKCAAHDEIAYGSIVNGQLARDAFDAATLRVQRRHFLVQRQTRGAPVIAQTLPSAKSRAIRQSLTPQCHTVDGDLLRCTAHLRPQSIQHSFDVVAQIA
ncbi:hypothetical protein QTI66_27945 [Variovorax sp. J22R133]|uniref:hypothetical protein n=1 Tax=Variovorax brevis TaxID=3053503 RepID=UPI002578E1CE|nr:hypothetical protein [Variovorax sp. J22R133]MDM0116010.1 hypothetical protein [Variovorax sp. J22R133]